MGLDTNTFDSDDERRLNLTQSIREDIISNVTKNGIPTNKEERAFLLAALDGLDRTTLGKARIKSDSNAHKQNQETANLVGELLTRITARNTPQISENQRSALPVLSAEYTVEPVAGETDIVGEELNYETFVAKVNQ